MGSGAANSEDLLGKPRLKSVATANDYYFVHFESGPPGKIIIKFFEELFIGFGIAAGQSRDKCSSISI